MKTFTLFITSILMSVSVFAQGTWEKLHQVESLYPKVAVSNDDAMIVAFVNYTSGLSADYSTDGGKSWKVLDSGRYSAAMVDDQHGIYLVEQKKVQFVSLYYPGPIKYTNDNGSSWTYLDTAATSGGQVEASVFRIDNMGTIHLVKLDNGKYIWKYSEDNGKTWNQMNLPTKPYSTFKASNGTLYCTSYNSGIYSSTDGGKNWTANTKDVGQITYGFLCEHPVTGEVYVVNGLGMGKTDDDGSNWTTVAPDPWIAMNIAKFFLTKDGMFYFYGVHGAYESSDGVKWNNIWNPGTNGPIGDMAVSDKYVYVTTSKDSSIYRYKRMTGGTTGIENHYKQAEVNIFPNPSQDQISINIENGQLRESSLNLEIVSVLGKVVYQRSIDTTIKTLSVDVSSFPSGVYVARLKNGKIESTKKFTITR